MATDRISFNPLHCGAVVASVPVSTIPIMAVGKFQSPSLRGSGRFHKVNTNTDNGIVGFQSPSLRGSGRFKEAQGVPVSTIPEFQSPSLRGSGRFSVSW